jgi:ABC-type uncharacterized transport system substrate-binding protein
MPRHTFLNKTCSAALCGVLSLSLLAGCADKKTNPTAKYKPISDSDDTSYSIALLASETTDRTTAIQTGFQDALTDTLGEKHYTLTIKTADSQNSVSSLASQIVNAGSSNEENELLGTDTSSKDNKAFSLIAAEGTSALTAASESTSSLPIVAMDVLNIRNTLHLQGDIWSDPTGTNVTGISSKIPLADYISMMIEATKDVHAVGLLYSPDDADAISQNETLETYLTEAGIPWKEYELQSTAVAKSALENATQGGISNDVILPNKIVAPNSVAGTYSAPEDLAGADLQGLNDDTSARTPKQSDNWTGSSKASGNAAAAEGVLGNSSSAAGGTTGAAGGSTSAASGSSSAAGSAATGSAASGSTTTAGSTTTGGSAAAASGTATPTEEDITAANTAILQTAASECSSLIIPPNSYLNDQAQLISSIATAAGVTTVAGDTDSGAYAAVTMYLDPYAIGYAAGQQVYRILVGNETPGDMELESVPGTSVVKLYNPDVCTALGLTLGKSFYSFSDYLAEHPAGSTTERITNSDSSSSK